MLEESEVACSLFFPSIAKHRHVARREGNDHTYRYGERLARQVVSLDDHRHNLKSCEK